MVQDEFEGTTGGGVRPTLHAWLPPKVVLWPLAILIAGLIWGFLHLLLLAVLVLIALRLAKGHRAVRLQEPHCWAPGYGHGSPGRPI